MKKRKISNGALSIIGGIVLTIFLSAVPLAAETKLHPFLKKEKVKVEPNVLLLIDTSGSMAYRMEDDENTWGDGTRPYKRPSTSEWGIYYGKDNKAGRNTDGNNDASDDFNYHPLLRFIPKKELTDAGITDSVADKWFAKRVAGKDPAALPGESDYKYPNDSRMYVLKNVMYRILNDETIVSNIRLALSTYDQKGPTWSDKNSDGGNYHSWPPERKGGNSFDRDRAKTPQGVYWITGDDNARLVEKFESTTNAQHLEDIIKWFDGEDDDNHKELRGYGWTPLAASIYHNSKDSAKKFFDGKDKNEKDVVSERCQDNWLVVLTDGADNVSSGTSGDPAESVKKLYEHFDNKDKKEIKTFVIGLIDHNASANKTLVKTLAKMADYGDDGKLSDTYGNNWTLNNNKGSSKPYFPRNMEELLNAFREIFYTIKEQASTGGAPLATPSKSASGDDSFYQAQYLPRNGRQWEGHLAKFEKKLDKDDEPYYPEVWEAGKELSKKKWSSRDIYTAHQDLSGTFSNVYPFAEGNALSLAGIMGIPSENSAEFIRWLRGKDEYDENKSGSTDDELHKLYDIYHSGLVKVGPPAGASVNSLYRKFFTENQDRETVIYVQSNAGMMHGFKDTDGEEIFAFIPPNVLSSKRLRGLRWADGGSKYDKDFSYPRYLADGPVIAEDVLFGSDDSSEYRTVLMGLLGLGGAGMYALDVTDPEHPAFLWGVENSVYEYSNSGKVDLLKKKEREVLSWQKDGSSTSMSTYKHDDIDDDHDYDYRELRLTVSTPFIGFLPTGEWAFVMGNGTAGEVNENPAGEIYIGSVEDGSLIKKFETSTNSPIVSPVAVLNDGVQGLIKTFFVGDTSGTVYRGDLSDSTNKNNWRVDPVIELSGHVGLSYSLDATRVNRRLWLFVGTGDTEGYLGSQSSGNYFVAADITDVLPGGKAIKQNELMKLSADNANEGLPLSSDKKGWIIEFGTGNKDVQERMSTSPTVYNGYVFFSTFLPSDDPCSDTGTSRLYALEVDTGRGGWVGNSKKYIELKDVKISGLSISGGQLILGMTNYGSGNLGDFKVIGENIIIMDAPDGSGGGGESGIMKPLYWKSR